MSAPACPFCLGFQAVEAGTIYTEPTPREVEMAWPEFTGDQVAMFINGAEDALRGDAFRLGLHLRGPVLAGWRCPLAVGVT